MQGNLDPVTKMGHGKKVVVPPPASGPGRPGPAPRHSPGGEEVKRCYAMILPWTLSLVLVFAAGAWTAEGEELYVRHCLSCHGPRGGAKAISPADKAESVWVKYFRRDRHPVKLSTLLDERERSQILVYLQAHAADSEHPVSAVIP